MLHSFFSSFSDHLAPPKVLLLMLRGRVLSFLSMSIGYVSRSLEINHIRTVGNEDTDNRFLESCVRDIGQTSARAH